MPALRCCMKSWAVGSNDFVLPALVSMFLHFVWIGADVSLMLYTYVLDCTPSPVGLFIGYIFCQLLIHLLVTISETFIFLESAKGPILFERITSGVRKHKDPREYIPILLGLRCCLFVLEGLIWSVGVSLTSVDKWVGSSSACPNEVIDTILNGFRAFNLSYGISLLLSCILFVALMDPLGCCGSTSFHREHKKRRVTTSPIEQRTRLVDASFSVRYSASKQGRQHPGQKFWTKVLNKLLCCVSTKTNDQYGSLESQIALALAILFENHADLVLSDIWAAYVLVQKHQQQKIKDVGNSESDCCVNNVLVKMMRLRTTQAMIGSQFLGGKRNYCYSAPKALDMSSESTKALIRTSKTLFMYAFGMYGWKLYGTIHKPCCGLCSVFCSMRCPCTANQSSHIACDGFHMDTAALALAADIADRTHILYASWKASLYLSPFAVIYDHEYQSIVVAIRGTMSIKDILTDFSTQMVSLSSEDSSYLPIAFQDLDNMVHMGMYSAAKEIVSKLQENSNCKENLLEACFDAFPNCKDPASGEKKLVIVGHSLGGGIASVLALLLRPHYPALKCFAYSAPGCVFSFSLAMYSKAFVTTFVVENDAVSRVNWRSLLFLKKSLETRLKECKAPKHVVLMSVCCHDCGIEHPLAGPAGLSRTPLLRPGLSHNRVHPPVTEQPKTQNEKPPASPDGKLLDEVFTSSFDNLSEVSAEQAVDYRLPPDGCDNPPCSPVPPPGSDEIVVNIEDSSTFSNPLLSHKMQESPSHEPHQVEMQLQPPTETQTAMADGVLHPLAPGAEKASSISMSNAFLITHMGSIWRGKTTVNKAVRQMKEISRVPAFVPGRVLLMEKYICKKHLCKCIAISTTHVKIHEVANEDMCFIDVGKNSFINHLPTRVLQMLDKAAEHHD